ncbi:hypothetical protein IU500_19010 [Nocardia terpenica]|uniref:hypothetical protein n=1 Tax=Nocardia terpenica TaxID=455432 RepID=UPI00189536E6|nr:hypothetical protein [Nocardia terpenica]MBF6062069.1 hypothetical protein [Nocardia terpenica]MBF6106131.1 hypothetical protein [Nocardia terpenica]MBF6110489.1 hypothetical protein [Nocardia terpenica]MBF6120674.1 hypothetical protein [Nocardia terpenica]MBF6151825.1 hypothetical protein [Nocardia terpenica]
MLGEKKTDPITAAPTINSPTITAVAVVIAPVDATVAVYSTRDPSPGGSAAIAGRGVPGAAHQPIAAASNSTARTMRAAWRCTAVLSGITRV